MHPNQMKGLGKRIGIAGIIFLFLSIIQFSSGAQDWLQNGWNTLMIKVLQGGGGWGYYVRFVDPEGHLLWKTEIE